MSLVCAFHSRSFIQAVECDTDFNNSINSTLEIRESLIIFLFKLIDCRNCRVYFFNITLNSSLCTILILQVSDPLTQALKFLRPLQDFVPQKIETHLLAFKVFYRKRELVALLSARGI